MVLGFKFIRQTNRVTIRYENKYFIAASWTFISLRRFATVSLSRISLSFHAKTTARELVTLCRPMLAYYVSTNWCIGDFPVPWLSRCTLSSRRCTFTPYSLFNLPKFLKACSHTQQLPMNDHSSLTSFLSKRNKKQRIPLQFRCLFFFHIALQYSLFFFTDQSVYRGGIHYIGYGCSDCLATFQFYSKRKIVTNDREKKTEKK